MTITDQRVLAGNKLKTEDFVGAKLHCHMPLLTVLTHLGWGEDATVLLNSVAYTVSSTICNTKRESHILD